LVIRPVAQLPENQILSKQVNEIVLTYNPSNMKTKITILLLLVVTYSFGQELPDLKAYSKDIGFNTNFLLNGIINSSGNPFDLMLKKQKTSNKAVRYGIQLFTDITTSTYQSSGYYQQRDYYSFSVSIGKEKQLQLSKKWIFYYGGDVAPFYQYYKEGQYSSGQLDYETLNKEVGLRVSPFIGIRFQILDRLYVSTEALLRLSYGRKETYWKSYDDTNTVTSETSQSFNNVVLGAFPASGVSIFYRF
jgi:hypothetical protein